MGQLGIFIEAPIGVFIIGYMDEESAVRAAGVIGMWKKELAIKLNRSGGSRMVRKRIRENYAAGSLEITQYAPPG